MAASSVRSCSFWPEHLWVREAKLWLPAGEAGQGERCKGLDRTVQVAGAGNSSGVSRHGPVLAPELPSPARADAGQSRPALSPAAALIFSLLIPVTPSLVA